MAEAKEASTFVHVVRRIDARSKLLRTWKPEGGVSAQLTALEVEQHDGQTKKMIVRQHGARDLAHNPHIAADEFKLLQLLHSVGVTAPEPYYLDESGEIFRTPYLVIEYIEGSSQFAPADLSTLLPQIARHLARIHRIDGSEWDLSFLPQLEKRYTELLSARPSTVDKALAEGRIRAVLESVWPLIPQNRSVLLHGDFWPGNILWKDGQLVAVIDWEDAGLGDPLADLANTRLELLWAFGIDAMQRFTHLYQVSAHIDFTHLPYWDLCAALRPIAQIDQWGLDEATERTMRERHTWFVTQALNLLSL